MKDLASQLKQFRHSTVMQCLISVNEIMGMPRFLNEEIIFIPFFRKHQDNETALTSRVTVSYPDIRIIKYERIIDEKPLQFNPEELALFKTEAIKTDFRYDTEDIPVCIREIYKENIRDDRSKNSL